MYVTQVLDIFSHLSWPLQSAWPFIILTKDCAGVSDKSCLLNPLLLVNTQRDRSRVGKLQRQMPEIWGITRWKKARISERNRDMGKKTENPHFIETDELRSTYFDTFGKHSGRAT